MRYYRNILNILGLGFCPVHIKGCSVSGGAHHSLSCRDLFPAGDGGSCSLNVLAIVGADALSYTAASIICPGVSGIIPSVKTEVAFNGSLLGVIHTIQGNSCFIGSGALGGAITCGAGLHGAFCAVSQNLADSTVFAHVTGQSTGEDGAIPSELGVTIGVLVLLGLLVTTAGLTASLSINGETDSDHHRHEITILDSNGLYISASGQTVFRYHSKGGSGILFGKRINAVLADNELGAVTTGKSDGQVTSCHSTGVSDGDGHCVESFITSSGIKGHSIRIQIDGVGGLRYLVRGEGDRTAECRCGQQVACTILVPKITDKQRIAVGLGYNDTVGHMVVVLVNQLMDEQSIHAIYTQRIFTCNSRHNTAQVAIRRGAKLTAFTIGAYFNKSPNARTGGISISGGIF